MEKDQFDEICSKLNIDEILKNIAIKQFTEVSRNTILEVSNTCFYSSDISTHRFMTHENRDNTQLT